jgi:hypothetical protein
VNGVLSASAITGNREGEENQRRAELAVKVFDFGAIAVGRL